MEREDAPILFFATREHSRFVRLCALLRENHIAFIGESVELKDRSQSPCRVYRVFIPSRSRARLKELSSLVSEIRADQ
jgi:hypothetical protein